MTATHTAFDLDSDEVEAVVYGGTGAIDHRLLSPPCVLREQRRGAPGKRKMVNIVIVGATGQVGVAMRQILLERGFPLTRSASSPPRARPARAARRPRDHRRGRATPTRRPRHRHCSPPGDDGRAQWHRRSRGRRRGRQLVGLADGSRRAAGRHEVNPDGRDTRKGIIANPTHDDGRDAGARPLHNEAGLLRMIVSTYQAVSGSGVAGVDERSPPRSRSQETRH